MLRNIFGILLLVSTFLPVVVLVVEGPQPIICNMEIMYGLPQDDVKVVNYDGNCSWHTDATIEDTTSRYSAFTEARILAVRWF